MKLTNDELIYLGNALNEVLRGFRVDNFEQRMKATKESIEQLWSKFARDGSGEVMLSASEITSLCNAMKLCFEEFGDEEFSTRLGVSPIEALRQVHALESLLR